MNTTLTTGNDFVFNDVPLEEVTTYLRVFGDFRKSNRQYLVLNTKSNSYDTYIIAVNGLTTRETVQFCAMLYTELPNDPEDGETHSSTPEVNEQIQDLVEEDDEEIEEEEFEEAPEDHAEASERSFGGLKRRKVVLRPQVASGAVTVAKTADPSVTVESDDEE